MSVDIGNLRNNIMFATHLAPGVEWVPFTVLGSPDFENDTVGLWEPITAKEHIKNIYQLIQYIQLHGYEICRDIHYEYDAGTKWEIHRDGQWLFQERSGSCASYAGMVSYLLSGRYKNISNLSIISNRGSGHAVNIVEHDHAMYVCDVYAQTNDNSKFGPIETGIKADYAKSQYVCGGCLRIEGLRAFAKFFSRYYIRRDLAFLFYITKGSTIPPVSMTVGDGNNEVTLRACDVIEWALSPGTSKLSLRLI